MHSNNREEEHRLAMASALHQAVVTAAATISSAPQASIPTATPSSSSSMETPIRASLANPRAGRSRRAAKRHLQDALPNVPTSDVTTFSVLAHCFHTEQLMQIFCFHSFSIVFIKLRQLKG